MKAEIILDWEYGTPSEEGMYLVAVKHGESAGFQEFVSWQNGAWALENGGEVIAYIGIESLNQQLVIQWPKEKPKPKPITEEFEEF